MFQISEWTKAFPHQTNWSHCPYSLTQKSRWLPIVSLCHMTSSNTQHPLPLDTQLIGFKYVNRARWHWVGEGSITCSTVIVIWNTQKTDQEETKLIQGWCLHCHDGRIIIIYSTGFAILKPYWSTSKGYLIICFIWASSISTYKKGNMVWGT